MQSTQTWNDMDKIFSLASMLICLKETDPDCLEIGNGTESMIVALNYNIWIELIVWIAFDRRQMQSWFFPYIGSAHRISRRRVIVNMKRARGDNYCKRHSNWPLHCGAYREHIYRDITSIFLNRESISPLCFSAPYSRIDCIVKPVVHLAHVMYSRTASYTRFFVNMNVGDYAFRSSVMPREWNLLHAHFYARKQQIRSWHNRFSNKKMSGELWLVRYQYSLNTQRAD